MSKFSGEAMNFKIGKYIQQSIAIAATFMCMSAAGDVLVSNFFDNNSADRGSIDDSTYKVSCKNGLVDDDPCDLENHKVAMSFTVGGELDYAFEGVQIELKTTGTFGRVNVYLDRWFFLMERYNYFQGRDTFSGPWR